MHSKEDQELLNLLKDKETRTSYFEFKKRWTLIKTYEYWYLTKNEMPHTDRWNRQVVLWLKDKGSRVRNYEPINIPHWLAMNEFWRIYGKLGLEWFSKNTKNNCSVNRFHIHIFNHK